MITISHIKPNFYLTFPYNADEVELVRNLPVRTWNKANKCWTVPELAAHTLEILPNVQWESEAKLAKVSVKKALLKLVDFKLADLANLNEVEYLRPYQRVGVNFMTFAKKSLLADDMGVGKTLQAITALIELGTERNLIIVPSTLKLNWDAEFKKHFDITPTIIGGTKKKRKELWQSDAKFIIANYDLFTVDRDWGDLPHTWDAIICDEIVYLKNHSAQRTKAIKKLKADVRIGLSGIPMETHLLEYHSIMEWVRPEVMTTYGRFKERYIEYDFDNTVLGYQNMEEFHQLTAPFVLRRTKDEVMPELPPKVYTPFPLEFDSKALKAYTAMADEDLEWLTNQTGEIFSTSPLDKAIRARQFVENPASLGFEDIKNIKLDWLKEIYAVTDKLVVFCCYLDTVDLLQKTFNTPYVMSSRTKTDDRVPMVDRYNAEDKAIFILTDAGKFGLNITGAANMVNFGHFYNPATMRQREDRLHRKGQEEQVHILNPYIVGTIDVGIREVAAMRQIENDALMDGVDKMSRARLSKIDFRKMMFGQSLRRKLEGKKY
jgi:SNF2 family DNA or RNA helicase